MSRSAWWTLAALASGLAVRLVALEADPPAWHGLGFVCDEGWWAHNARNAALFGKLVLTEPRDEFNQGLVMSPAFTLLAWASFVAFGASLWSLRLVSAVMACVAAAALAWAARGTLGAEAAPRAAALYLFAPFTWAFGRVGLVEETMNAFLAVTLAAWLVDRPWGDVLAGLAHAAAFATKSYGAFAGVALVASLFLLPVAVMPWRVRAGKLLRYGAAVAAGLALWAALVYVPHRDDYRELSLKLSQDNLPRGPLQALRNAADLLLELSPRPMVAAAVRHAAVPAAMAALALSAMAGLPLATLRRDRLASLAVPMLAVYAALLAPMQYKPDRRYMALLLPVVLLACWATTHAGGSVPAAGRVCRLLAAAPLGFLAAALPAALLAADRNGAAVAFVASGLLLTAALWVALPGLWPALVRAARAAVPATLLLFAAVAGPELGRATFTMADEGRELAALVGTDAVLGGVADTLLLQSRATVYNSMRKGTTGRFNGDIASRADVRWVITWTQPERPAVHDAPVPGRLSKVRETPILPRAGAAPRATIELWRHETAP